ncbi:hypothetical protein VTN96DRAFT_1833 [Rasamsonia emersonii]
MSIRKSQIAIEYCYRVKDRQPQTNVFWVHAGSKESFALAYKGLAEHLGLPGLDNPRVDVLHLVAERLRHESHSRWLIVLDGAGDRDSFFSDDFSSCYIPESPACSILVTTTDESVGRRLTRAEPIKVRCPTVEEAAKLLRARLITREDNEPDEETKAVMVATLLNKLPLAITQAAAYINDNGISLGRFIEILRTSPADQQYLLKYGGSRSVTLTFQLCFDRVARDPRAAELLSLMSVLEWQEIPKLLLRKEKELEAEFTNALGKLMSLSLITAENDGETFTMHQHVQWAAEDWLKKRKVGDYHGKAVEQLARLFPTAEYENWKQCRVLFPHAKAVLEYRHASTLPYAELLHKVARYQWQQERFDVAQTWAQNAYVMRRKLLGENNAKTVDSLALLGSVLECRGHYAEALEKHQKALEWRKRVLGEENPATLESMNEVGVVLRKQRQYRRAEVMHRQALAGRLKVLSEDDPATLTTMDDLGVVLANQEKYEEAEAMHRRALAGKMKVLGRDHPMTLASIEYLASVLSDQRRTDEAWEIYQQVLDLYTMLLGESHSDTVSCVNNLACVLLEQGKYAEAENLYRQVAHTYKRVLGEAHQYTLTSLQNLAGTLVRQDKHSEAEKVCREVLAAMENSQGKENPATLVCLRRLALTVQNQERYEEAEELYRRALRGWEKRSTDDKEEAAACLNGLVEVLRSQRKDQEAEWVQARWNAPGVWVIGVLARMMYQKFVDQWMWWTERST